MAELENNQANRRKRWWILGAVIAIIGLIIGWQLISARQNRANTLANIETVPYQRRDLSANIFGTGTIQPLQTAELTWSTGGTVGEVFVTLGDTVEKDSILLALDPGTYAVDVLQAQIDVINAQNALDDLFDNWEADLAQAKLDLIEAEDDLEDKTNKRVTMNYQRCTDERIEDLEDDLERAELIYKFRQNADTLRAVNTAQANLNFCLAGFTEQEVAEAELEVELAESRLVRAQKRVDTLTDGPDPDQVTILETQLAMAQTRADSPMIKAPFTGVVTRLYSNVGDVVQTGTPALRLDTLVDLNLDVQISEIDIPFVAVGQPTQLVFDAYFDSQFSGTVIEISPVGITNQGVVEYDMRISLQDADERIKPGMTAAITIVIEEKTDVLVVPNDAIVSRNGVDTVYVKRNGGFEAVEVRLGSYSDFYSEVIEADIREGEPIALNPPAEITGQAQFGGPPQGPFGRFGN